MTAKLVNLLRRYFIAGLLIWLPIWVTLLVIRFVINLSDNTFSLLPRHYRPDLLLGFHIPGLGVLIGLLLMFLTGLLVTNFLGKKLITFWENILGRIPLVRSIHAGVKQVLSTLLSSQTNAFRQVLLVEYPRQGMWTIAFLTNNNFSTANQHLDCQTMTVFIPTTPNPTSGFLVILPKSQIKKLDISVDEALKMVISLGTITPQQKNHHLNKKDNKG